MKTIIFAIVSLTLLAANALADDGFLKTSDNLGMIEFKKPGSYKLLKKDYGDAKILIFELWGGGSGGNTREGGSGAYVKVEVPTVQHG